jgi:hypothetical protein
MAHSAFNLARQRMVEMCGVRLPEHLGEALAAETASGALNWHLLLTLATRNRTVAFLHPAIRKLGIADRLPPPLIAHLRQEYLNNYQRNLIFEAEVKQLLEAFNLAELPLIVLRGVMMSDKVFGNPALRSSNDIDILIRREDLRQVKGTVQGLNFVQDPRFLDDEYYERHHLHLPYLKLERLVLLEIHWSYDHKYTPFNVDTASTFASARRSEYQGLSILELGPEDLLVMLCLHAFKHSCSIKYTLGNPEAGEMVLADGGFVQFLDLHYGVEYARPDIDWELFGQRVERWNLQVPVLASLRVMETFFRHDPESRVPEFPGTPPVGRLERVCFTVLSGLISPTRKQKQMNRGGVYGRFDKVTKIFFFNTVRLFDIFSFIVPAPGFLRVRYHRWPKALLPLLYPWHLLVFAGQATLNLLDMIRFGIRKKLRGPVKSPFATPAAKG